MVEIDNHFQGKIRINAQKYAWKITLFYFYTYFVNLFAFVITYNNVDKN